MTIVFPFVGQIKIGPKGKRKNMEPGGKSAEAGVQIMTSRCGTRSLEKQSKTEQRGFTFEFNFYNGKISLYSRYPLHSVASNFAHTSICVIGKRRKSVARRISLTLLFPFI